MTVTNDNPNSRLLSSIANARHPIYIYQEWIYIMDLSHFFSASYFLLHTLWPRASKTLQVNCRILWIFQTERIVFVTIAGQAIFWWDGVSLKNFVGGPKIFRGGPPRDKGHDRGPYMTPRLPLPSYVRDIKIIFRKYWVCIASLKKYLFFLKTSPWNLPCRAPEIRDFTRH